MFQCLVSENSLQMAVGLPGIGHCQLGGVPVVSIPDPGLSRHERRLTCVHEAAHAVMYAIGGYKIAQVAVAPEGATDWTVKLRKGGVLHDLWGVCEKFEDHPAARCKTSKNRFDRQMFRTSLKPFPGSYRRKIWRQIRAHLCGVVAGELAEHLYLGNPPEFNFDGEGDGVTAIADDCLLLGRDNLEYMVELVIQKLQSSDVWGLVIQLADALEMSGCVDDRIEAFLPVPEPGWPPTRAIAADC